MSDWDELHIREPHDHQGVCGQIVITQGGRLVHPEGSADYLWPHRQVTQVTADSARFHFLGAFNDEPVFTLECSGDEAGDLGAAVTDLRQVMANLSSGMFRLLGRAIQINEWYGAHRFCGHCGSATQPVPNERAMGCPDCGKVYYPRISPCVMAMVVRGEECLLARNSQWPVGRYSVVAGFIEPGESVEAAVHREVREEVGVEVHNLEYFDSQPWPFPSQLMLGFFAEYRSGDIQVDGAEIAEAHWYHYSQLPMIPGEFSLSGQLIRRFVERCQRAAG